MDQIYPFYKHEKKYIKANKREAEEVAQPRYKTTVAALGMEELRFLNPSNIHYERHADHEYHYWIYVRDEDNGVEVYINRDVQPI
jgi:hypothetical protein